MLSVIAGQVVRLVVVALKGSWGHLQYMLTGDERAEKLKALLIVEDGGKALVHLQCCLETGVASVLDSVFTSNAGSVTRLHISKMFYV